MRAVETAVLRNERALANAYAVAAPFRHVVIDDFLDAGLCRGLLDEFPTFETRRALNEMGEVGGKAVRTDVRALGARYRTLDDTLQSRDFLEFVSRLTGIPDLIHDPDHVGGGTHDNREGQSLDVHVDFNYHPRTQWHRRLNLIVYLNPVWEVEWGGAVELHSDPWSPLADHVTSVQPLYNRCVIFETIERSWHGFSPIRLPQVPIGLSRKSFAIYLYSRERPAAELAPPHATVYVPPMTMPRQWHAGHVLREDDVRDLLLRFTRLSTQLRYLYDREKHFGAQIAALEGALAEASAAQRLEVQGYATQPQGTQGLWPDGRAGARMSTRLVPTRPLKGLHLDLWAPPQLERPQSVRFDVNGRSTQHDLPPGASKRVTMRLHGQPGDDVSVTVDAACTWTPSADSESGGQRALAYRIVGVELEH